MDKSLKKRGLFVAALTAVLLLATLVPATLVPAGASSRPARWWQYDLDTWSHTWRSVPTLVRADKRWNRKHPDATNAEVSAYEQTLANRYLSMHFHQSAGVQRGKASWFSASHGYCTKNTSGYYAASRTLPCGTQVSVRSGDKYVIVTIEDRGPYVSGRILDLSKSAFRVLAPIGSGVINVTATRLRN